MMRDFRERWQAVAAIEAEEQRSASIDLRWQQTNAILRMAIGLGLSLEEANEPEQTIYDRWSQLKGL
jgi:hypothetical protein